MTIFLRRPLVDRLIENKFEIFNDLLTEWEYRAGVDDGYPRSRKKSAIYDWLDDGIPTNRGRNRHLLFALCGLLDADPMALLDYEKNRFFREFTQIRMAMYMFSERVFGSGVSNFAPLIDMFMPGPRWPNDEMANRFYGREWFGYEFDNAGHEQSHDYGLVKVKFSEKQSLPIRSVHIAYRRRRSNDKMWRYYGLVNLIDNRLELYTEGGDHHSMVVRAPNQIWFRTSFGHRPVEFRLVSLHNFTYTTEISDDMSIIGFNW